MLVPGELFAEKFRVERVLGTGGMGEVWLAKHVDLDEHVALKVLAARRASDPLAIERFRKEARAAARLRGEHVVRVRDFGVADGTPFLVMDFVHGQTLAELLRQRGQLSVQEAVSFALEACSGLAEAHAAGVIHRDVKPSNLMLANAPGGRVVLKVLDFGVAKTLATGEQTLTSTSATLGSPLYMSPEQVRDAHRVDARTDVWALGVTLYEMLSGRRPFEASTAAGVLALVATEAPTPLSTHLPGVPPGLERVVMGCLERELDVRTRSVVALADALAPFVSDGVARRAQVAELSHAHPAVITIEETATSRGAGWLDVGEAGRSHDALALTRAPDGPTLPRPKVRGRAWFAVAAGVLVAAGVVAARRPPNVAAPPASAAATSPVPPASTSSPAATASLRSPTPMVSTADATPSAPIPTSPPTTSNVALRPTQKAPPPTPATRAVPAAEIAAPAGLPDPDSLGGRK